MLSSLVLLALPLAGVALPAPGNNLVAERALTAAPAVTTHVLARRQLPNEEAAIEGYSSLLEEATSRVGSLSGDCQSNCRGFLSVTDVCINQPSADEALTCQCTTETIIQMNQCAACLSDDQFSNAKGFQTLCTSIMSSISAGSGSSTSSSDPFNGLGTVSVGTAAVTIATYDPNVDYSTRTSTPDGPRNGGDMPTSRTTSATGSSATEQVNGGDEGPSDGAVALKVQGGLAVGAIGLVAAIFAL
ncbi:hypothetical protein JCM6882_002407 [Rhodosporidiobolus microsporus]